MAYKDIMRIGPDVAADLRQLKRRWRLQSRNKVLRRLFGDPAVRQLVGLPPKDGQQAPEREEGS